MKRAFIVAAALVATTAWIAADVAEAKRMGGGRSFGAQRQMAPQAAPSPSSPAGTGAATGPAANPVMPRTPATAAAPAAAAGAAAKAAPAASGMSRWMGPIAGLAAGLGIAALMSHLGLSEAFGNFLMLALLAVAGVFLVRMLMRRGSAPTQSPLQYAGNAPGRVEPTMPAARVEPVAAAASSSSVTSVPASRFPPGFDPAPFAEQAKQQFRTLQAAYDRGDVAALADVMTPEMYAEVSRDVAARGTHAATQIMQLDAEIIEATTEGRQHWVGVRFTGLLREDGTLLPSEFEEVWNLVKPVDDSSGWLLAGIQQPHAVA